jgi:hypothetical protein
MATTGTISACLFSKSNCFVGSRARHRGVHSLSGNDSSLVDICRKGLSCAGNLR